MLNVNSGVFIDERKGQIIKTFLEAGADSKINFRRETLFYEHCNQSGIETIPRVIKIDETQCEITLSYFDGEEKSVGSIEDLHRFGGFIQRLNIKSPKNLVKASEGFHSIGELEELLHSRMLQLANNEGETSEVFSELSKQFEIVLKITNSLRHEKFTILANPSDLGLHNYRVSQSDYVFFDFGYSGSDCAEKLLYDFCLHPRNKFNGLSAQTVFEKLSLATDLRVEFKNEWLCIFSFWWCLRLLNSLSPRVIEARKKSGVLAEADVANYMQERQRNLSKFREYFNAVR